MGRTSKDVKSPSMRLNHERKEQVVVDSAHEVEVVTETEDDPSVVIEETEVVLPDTSLPKRVLEKKQESVQSCFFLCLPLLVI